MAYKQRAFVYTANDTFSPEIIGSGSNPTVTYNSQNGRIYQLDDMVFINIFLNINTFSGGSGDARITIPVTSATSPSIPQLGPTWTGSVSFPSSTKQFVAKCSPNTSYVTIEAVRSTTTSTPVQISNIAAGDLIEIQIMVWV